MESLAEATSVQTIDSYANDWWLQMGMGKGLILGPTNSHMFFSALCSRGLDAEVAMLQVNCCPSLYSEEDQTNLWCWQKHLFSDAAILRGSGGITTHEDAGHHHPLEGWASSSPVGRVRHHHPWGRWASPITEKLGISTHREAWHHHLWQDWAQPPMGNRGIITTHTPPGTGSNAWRTIF